jgi:hypothetical protein
MTIRVSNVVGIILRKNDRTANFLREHIDAERKWSAAMRVGEFSEERFQAELRTRMWEDEHLVSMRLGTGSEGQDLAAEGLQRNGCLYRVDYVFTYSPTLSAKVDWLEPRSPEDGPFQGEDLNEAFFYRLRGAD